MDLADLSSVKDFADRFLASGRRLDVLMNNAGLVSWEHMTTKDGHELTYQVLLFEIDQSISNFDCAPPN